MLSMAGSGVEILLAAMVNRLHATYADPRSISKPNVHSSRDDKRTTSPTMSSEMQ